MDLNKLLKIGMKKWMITYERWVFSEVNQMIHCIFECKITTW
jgi:hypothetical protein